MKSLLLTAALLFVLSSNSFSQSQIESDIESALVNAKKGVYWGLSNIPTRKTKIEKSIINEDKLIAKVKVSKEVNGIRVEATGYYLTNEVSISLYKSAESLIKDGYIKKGDLELFSEDE